MWVVLFKFFFLVLAMTSILAAVMFINKAIITQIVLSWFGL